MKVCTDAQAYLSHRWAHMSEGLFSCVASQICFLLIKSAEF